MSLVYTWTKKRKVASVGYTILHDKEDPLLRLDVILTTFRKLYKYGGLKLHALFDSVLHFFYNEKELQDKTKRIL